MACIGRIDSHHFNVPFPDGIGKCELLMGFYHGHLSITMDVLCILKHLGPILRFHREANGDCVQTSLWLVEPRAPLGA